jgi:hypothetical protein
MAKANQSRARIAELKSELRSGRLDLEALLADPRAKDITILRLLPMIPRSSQRTALQVLLECQINGADTCGELSENDRARLVKAFAALIGRRSRHFSRSSGGDDLDRIIDATHKVVPIVEHRPTEFIAARIGLEADPQLMRMVDRLVATLRLYEDHDDGGVAAHRTVDQFLRYMNYRKLVANSGLPATSFKSPPEVE